MLNCNLFKASQPSPWEYLGSSRAAKKPTVGYASSKRAVTGFYHTRLDVEPCRRTIIL
jgi:hypothetical protein